MCRNQTQNNWKIHSPLGLGLVSSRCTEWAKAVAGPTFQTQPTLAKLSHLCASAPAAPSSLLCQHTQSSFKCPSFMLSCPPAPALPESMEMHLFWAPMPPHTLSYYPVVMHLLFLLLTCVVLEDGDSICFISG